MSDRATLERRLVESYENMKRVVGRGKELDVPWFIRERAEDEAMLRFNQAAIALADALRDEQTERGGE